MIERFGKKTVRLLMSGWAMAAMVSADAAASSAASAMAPMPVAGVGASGCTPANLPSIGTASPKALPEPTPAQLQTAVLQVENATRAEVGVEPLTYDTELARGAQYWASMIVRTGVQKHDPDSFGGEEMTGWDGAAMFTPEQLISGFVAEKVWFKNVGFPDAVAACDGGNSGPGHYFGLVRRAAYRVGCGVASKDNFRVIICRHAPGYAPKDELAWPTTDKPWPTRVADHDEGPWVESARFDIPDFERKMLAVNVGVRPALTWDPGLAEAAFWDSLIRMRAGSWDRVEGVSPPASPGEIVQIAAHGFNGDVTSFPDADTLYGEFLKGDAQARAKLTGSAWTRVGCGTAIRVVGDQNRRMVLCRYS